MTTKTLAEGLVAAQVAAREVEKGGYNKHHSYAYASAEDMIKEGRVALAAGDLALVEVGRAWEAVPTNDAPGRVLLSYELVHGPSATVKAWTSSTWVVPGKGRPLDKAESGAITENLSYTLRGLLLLPRVDEGTSVETRADDGPGEQRGTDLPADPVVRDLRARAAAADDAGLNDVLDAIGKAKLAEDDEQDVLADVACRGFDLATSREDIDLWVSAIAQWKLKGEPKVDAATAYKRATERIGA